MPENKLINLNIKGPYLGNFPPDTSKRRAGPRSTEEANLLTIDHKLAAEILRAEATAATEQGAPNEWTEKVAALSRLCAKAKANTHIAFLGTILLAKAVDRRADIKWIKPAHSKGAANAFSARTLSEKVLVPISAELGIHLGTTGPQPLNNQPYFRMSFLGDNTPVHVNSRPAFDYMLSLAGEIEKMPDEASARSALRAFILVRLQSKPLYSTATEVGVTSTRDLVTAIERFVGENSEGGRRAQAVVAGLLDATFGPERIITDRINSPSRRYPGDICVRADISTNVVGRAFEVKDKPVSVTDIQIFARKCLDFGVTDAAYVMISTAQLTVDLEEVGRWAHENGIKLFLFSEWRSLVEQSLFWNTASQRAIVTDAVRHIRRQLIEIEVSPSSIEIWDALTARNG